MFGVKGKLLPFECDITDEHQIKACFRYIGEKFDGIDLLVSIKFQPWDNDDDED